MNSGAMYPLLTAREIADLKKDSLSKADVVWRAEGVIGTLKVIPRLAGVDAKEIATAGGADDLKAFRGQVGFGSSRARKGATWGGALRPVRERKKALDFGNLFFR